MSDDAARKIGALLAKAERTDNPHEAEAYTRKAEALMVKLGIDEAMARAAGGADARPEAIVERKIRLWVPAPTRTWRATADDATQTCGGACGRDLPARKFPTTKYRNVREVECRECRDARYKAGAVRPRESAAYNRVHIEGFFDVVRALGLRGYRRGDGLFFVVGFERDADRAVALLRSLQLQAVSAMWSWWKAEGSLLFARGWADMEQADRLRVRREFTLSFYEGAAHRIRSEHRAQVDATPGAALAVRDKRQEVNDHVDAMNLQVGKALDLGHSAAGYEAGKAANVGGGNAVRGGRLALGRGREDIV